ncbi:MAG: hypothetical protein ACRETD_07760 [Steroidobacteraceae bacterium]
MRQHRAICRPASSSRPDANYAKTRAFHAAMGFLEIEEFPLLWNPENPAAMLIRVTRLAHGIAHAGAVP